MNILSALTILIVALISSAAATSVEEKSLKQLVSLSDNIWGGQVTSVRMTDGKGRKITDPEAMTGPGLNNTIFLDVVVDPNLILKSTRTKVPLRMSIPLWKMWHYSLADIKEMGCSKSIFLLTKELKPAYPSDFQRPLSEDRKIRGLIRKLRSR